MSSPAVIAKVSEHIQGLLRRVLGLNENEVVLENPHDANAGVAVLSIWLYQVAPDEHLRNMPATTVRQNGDGRRQRSPPLALNLHYMLTPMRANATQAQRDLGNAMLVLHENSTISLEDAGERINDDVRISLASDQLDDRTRLWESLTEPHRLSVCYIVRSVRIDGEPELVGGRVEDRTANLGDPIEESI